MTRAELDRALALPASYALDVIIERVVFGVEPCDGLVTIDIERDGYPYYCPKCGKDSMGGYLPGHPPAPYSTDMGAAWRIVELLRETGRIVELTASPIADIARVATELCGQWVGTSDAQPRSGAPLAICRAALRALAKGGK